MPNPRVVWGIVDRAFDADGNIVPGARLYVQQNRTTTLVDQILDVDGNELSQPREADAFGVFQPVYVPGADYVRVSVFKPVAGGGEELLPGYPIDDVPPLGSAGSAASISFEPSETIQASNVQDAIDAVGETALAQPAIVQRALTPWSTAGSGDAYTIAPTPALTGYGTWQSFIIAPDRDNTGAATLNVNGLGAQTLAKLDRNNAVQALVAGDIRKGWTQHVVWDGTRFLIRLGELPEGSSAYQKTKDGWLICRDAVTLTQANSNALTATWEVPSGNSFVSVPSIALTLPFAGGNYTNVAEIDCGSMFQSTGTASFTVGVRRAAGGTAFPSNASITLVRVLAVGRWY